MDGQRLLFLFAFLMIVIGVLMLRPRRAATAPAQPVDRRMCLLTAFAALLVGGASGLFGIGGGFLIVPALLAATGMPMINAVGSSLLAVSAFGLATAINYAASGLIDWLLAAEFIGGGIFGGMIGFISRHPAFRRKRHAQPHLRRRYFHRRRLHAVAERCPRHTDFSTGTHAAPLATGTVLN